ncbi:hypothetical protein GCM10027592_29700 [Spirosoma flavus]
MPVYYKIISPIVIVGGALLICLSHPVILKIRSKHNKVLLDNVTTCFFSGASFFVALRMAIKTFEKLYATVDLDTEHLYTIGASVVVVWNAFYAYYKRTWPEQQ